jgi:hypothetical protein
MTIRIGLPERPCADAAGGAATQKASKLAVSQSTRNEVDLHQSV